MSTGQASLLEILVEEIEVPTGEPPAPPGREAEAERFWSKVEVRGDLECWPWMGGRTPRGYGRFSVTRGAPGEETKVYPHRWVFEAFHGPIGDELTVDHLVCDNPPCVSPLHLVKATSAENTLRGTGLSALNARKMECVNGHPFTAANTRINAAGDRACRTCDRERKRELRARKKKEEAHE